MQSRTLTGVVLLAPLTLAGSPAQETAGPCPTLYPNLAVGDFADLRFTSTDPDAGVGAMEIRFAVVDREDVDGRRHFWIEVVSDPPAAGGTVIAQMLVPYFPFENSDIKGYVVKMPGRPAARMPDEMIQRLAASAPMGPGWQQHCDSASNLGSDRVTVPAGTFEARHYRGTDDDKVEVWLADVPFGLVKMTQPGGNMELVRYGRDAKSSIEERPEPPPHP